MSPSIAKQEIMKARQPKVVDLETIEYHNAADAVYQLIKKYSGLDAKSLNTALVHAESDINEKAISNALYNMKREGYLRAEPGKGDSTQLVYFVTDQDYKLRGKKVGKKVAPNDKKAHKSIRRMTRIKPGVGVVEQPSKQESLPLENVNGTQEPQAAPVQAEEKPVQSQDANLKVSKPRQGKAGKFEYIQGMAALDPNSPHFGETARELAKKTIDANGVEFEPKAFMFFELGNESLVLTPAQARKLYNELHAAFGNK